MFRIVESKSVQPAMSTAYCRIFAISVLTGMMMHGPQTDASPEKPEAAARAAIAAQQQHRVHTSEQFAFVANARSADVFPLFGADMERVWAPGWQPRFLWPASPGDQAGMVFLIAHDHGHKSATWVNTVFDSAAGRVQYVYVLPDVVATVITLQLQARGDKTEVVVRYERTSLSPESDALVKNMAEHDRLAGRQWASQINDYFSRSMKR